MSSDLQRVGSVHGYDSHYIRKCVLQDIHRSFEQMGSHIDDYHFVANDLLFACNEHLMKEIESEQNVHFSRDDLLMVSQLNAGQSVAYDAIMIEIFSLKG